MKILYQDILYPLILGPFPKLNCYLPQAKDDTALAGEGARSRKLDEAA